MCRMKTVVIGDNVRVRIGENIVPAVVLDENERGSFQVRLQATGSIIWTRRIVEVIRQNEFPCHGLLNAAISILQTTKKAMSAGELIREILNRDLWSPTRKGKTPRLTLYAMLYTEYHNKEFPRVEKAEGGLWRAT